MKATNVGAGAGVTRVALANCNVLFGTETRAVSQTQAGIGDPGGTRIDGRIDANYMNKGDQLGAIFGAIGSATSGQNPAAAEGALLKALNASGLHVNVMVDFAKAKGSKVWGFLGRMAGNDEAKVEAKMQLSVSGFFVLHPLESVECYAGNVCRVGTNERKSPRVTTRQPLVAVRDIQTQGSKAGEAGLEVLTGLMALGGTSTTSTTIERNGVEVDPVRYAENTRERAGRLVAMAAVLTRQ